MQQLPISLHVRGRRAVIVGGGETARRKAVLFDKAGAELEFYSSAFEPCLAEAFPSARFVRRLPEARDLETAALVCVATDDEALLSAGLQAAREAGKPINVVDRPELCDWTTPSIVDRGSVTVAVATGGAAPVLARDLRAKIEALIPQRLGVLAEAAAALRPLAKSLGLVGERGRAAWERVLRGPEAARVLAGDNGVDGLRSALERAGREGAETGVVHLVGAGPGDPELLTLKALQAIQDADVIFYDQLVGPGILDLARRDAERVFVGKKRAAHALAQDRIHLRLIEEARKGRRVVRLKGGDPFVFGRGGEELAALRAAGVETIVVPGISSALGCAAAAGVPLTHRAHAQSLVFVTGHAADGEPDLDWDSLARPNRTVVVFMGVASAARTQSALIRHGRAADTPFAVIENGTLPAQKIVAGELADMAALMAEAGIEGPAILIIGEVAAYADARQLETLAQLAA